jgi:hypothetical protein
MRQVAEYGKFYVRPLVFTLQARQAVVIQCQVETIVVIGPHGPPLFQLL